MEITSHKMDAIGGSLVVRGCRAIGVFCFERQTCWYDDGYHVLALLVQRLNLVLGTFRAAILYPHDVWVYYPCFKMFLVLHVGSRWWNFGLNMVLDDKSAPRDRKQSG